MVLLSTCIRFLNGIAQIVTYGLNKKVPICHLWYLWQNSTFFSFNFVT